MFDPPPEEGEQGQAPHDPVQDAPDGGRWPRGPDSPLAHTRLRSLLVLGVLAVVLPLVAALLFRAGSNANRRSGQARTVLTIGTPIPQHRAAPPFSLPLLGQDGSRGPSTFAHRVLVLNFWASWCTACRAEAPVLDALWRQYKDREVQFLGIDTNDSQAKAIEFQRQFGVTYPSVVDRGGMTASRYGVVGLPTTFIVGSDSQIAFEVIGRIEPTSFSRAIDTAGGGSPSPTS